MKNKKVYVVKAKTEEELAEKINNFEKEVFATQPVFIKKGEWAAFLYVDESEPQRSFTSSSIKPITEKQKFLLNRAKKEGYYKGDVDGLSLLD